MSPARTNRPSSVTKKEWRTRRRRPHAKSIPAYPPTPPPRGAPNCSTQRAWLAVSGATGRQPWSTLFPITPPGGRRAPVGRGGAATRRHALAPQRRSAWPSCQAARGWRGSPVPAVPSFPQTGTAAGPIADVCLVGNAARHLIGSPRRGVTVNGNSWQPMTAAGVCPTPANTWARRAATARRPALIAGTYPYDPRLGRARLRPARAAPATAAREAAGVVGGTPAMHMWAPPGHDRPRTQPDSGMVPSCQCGSVVGASVGAIRCGTEAVALCSLNGVGPQTQFVLWKGVVGRSHIVGLWSTL